MLTDTVPFARFAQVLGTSPRMRAARSLASLLERKLGVRLLVESEALEQIREVTQVARILAKHGIIERYVPRRPFADEPQFFMWTVEYGPSKRTSGGLSLAGEEHALTAALAEALERHLWYDTTDYFEDSFAATVEEAGRRGAIIEPGRFAGYGEKERTAHEILRLDPAASYLWIRGRSLTRGTSIYLPAQTISCKHARDAHGSKREPVIRMPVTTGLATGQNETDAVLGGALETIERDAYMIMWLNQLTLPRLDLTQFSRDPEVAELLARCARYRLRVSALRLLTDAPADVVCAVVQDESAEGPPLTLGLKAHARTEKALAGAILEALRSRVSVRMTKKEHPALSLQSPADIQLRTRLHYWNDAGRARRLSFLTDGPVEHTKEAAWRNDTPAQHLERVVTWARNRGYEFAVVELGSSKENPTPWRVYMSVIPELQPMHLDESLPFLGGARLAEIPRAFGLAPRAAAYADEPHPFA